MKMKKLLYILSIILSSSAFAQNVEFTKDNFKDSFVEERFSLKHDELGELYLRHSRFDDALEQFRKAYNMTQMRRPEIGTSIGECLILKNQIPQAMFGPAYSHPCSKAKQPRSRSMKIEAKRRSRR